MENDRSNFERVAAAIQGDIALAAMVATQEPMVRAAYERATAALIQDLRHQVATGQLSWAQAAQQAQEGRNIVMETMRGRTTPIGRAMAEALKQKGRTLNELIARYTIAKFGANAVFDRLSAAQKNEVFAEIVAAAGRSNPRVNALMRNWSRAGRGLILLSLAISAYNIAVAEDQVAAAGREVAVTGAGIGGGIAGGALAGLACGPGAPVCVTIGAFAGGALAAFGVGLFF